MRRFTVTQIEGDLTPRVASVKRPTGLSCHVIDAAFCHRVVASYRTESYNHLRSAEARAHVKRLAIWHAASLNAR